MAPIMDQTKLGNRASHFSEESQLSVVFDATHNHTRRSSRNTDFSTEDPAVSKQDVVTADASNTQTGKGATAPILAIAAPVAPVVVPVASVASVTTCPYDWCLPEHCKCQPPSYEFLTDNLRQLAEIEEEKERRADAYQYQLFCAAREHVESAKKGGKTMERAYHVMEIHYRPLWELYGTSDEDIAWDCKSLGFGEFWDNENYIDPYCDAVEEVGWRNTLRVCRNTLKSTLKATTYGKNQIPHQRGSVAEIFQAPVQATTTDDW